jgi:flagellar biosynthesis protein FlhB
VSDRNVPASPRRLALARKAGAVAHAPSLTTAAAWAGALAALVALAPSLLGALGSALRRGLLVASEPVLAGPAPPAGLQGGAMPSLVSSMTHSLGAALMTALPVLIAGAAAALFAHVAQTRALWIPRRQVKGAPQLPGGFGARAAGGLWAAVRGAALAAVGLGWLMAAAPSIAAGMQLEDGRLLPASAALMAGAALALVATWIGLGVLELIGRAWQLAQAAKMTPAELREEQRSAGGASRSWAEQRRRSGAKAVPKGTRTAAGTLSLAARDLSDLEGAWLLLAGDEVCAAVAWHPRRMPVPRVIAVRRGRGVESLLALARRRSLPIRRAPELAQRLAEAGPGVVPEASWRELAALVASAGS